MQIYYHFIGLIFQRTSHLKLIVSQISYIYLFTYTENVCKIFTDTGLNSLQIYPRFISRLLYILNYT